MTGGTDTWSRSDGAKDSGDLYRPTNSFYPLLDYLLIFQEKQT